MKKLFVIIWGLILFSGDIFAAQNAMKLWYDKPATDWNGALPLGNGRLGAMVFGTPAVEHIQLNEETIWAGSPNSNAHRVEDGVLDRVRQLIFEGKYIEAQAQAAAIMSPTNHGMPYQTMGDMFISFAGHNRYTDFYRDLDIATATATVRYKVDGTTYTREMFTSFVDQAVIVRITADKPASISCNLILTTPQEKVEREVEHNTLVLRAITPAHEKQSGKVQFETRIKPKVLGGRFEVKDDIISIESADEVVFYICTATNFVNYKDLSADKTAKCRETIESAFSKTYSFAKSQHTAYFRQFMDRVSIDLGETAQASKPTDVRIEEFAQSSDPSLVALYFQFGRYLLICSSQPGTQPANLQGIWNDRYLPSWDSKYTVNINTQMNYWPAEPTNLSEMHEPMLQMVREVATTGEQTAKTMYGARGWVLHHNTDIWRITAPVDRAASGMWPTGGAWVTQHLWYRYLYTGDVAFLREIYPVMRGAAMFFNDFLIAEPHHGWLVVSPSLSPENTHAGGDNTATISAGTTMDNQLVFDLFSNVIVAAQILDIDKQFCDTLQAKRAKLPPMQIGQHTQLQEWMYDWDSPTDTHRHVSHLYGLYPSNQISPIRTPELFEAARNSLIYRGDPSTGWSMGWKVCLWARLLDGEHAYKLLTQQLNLVTNQKKQGGTYTNMFDAHPPFQIDGNFGCTAGIAEMFVQSHDGYIHILPALPSVWSKGSVTGLVTRGGFVVDVQWEGGELKRLKIYSAHGGNCRIRVAVPIQTKGLRKAKGENPNQLFATPQIQSPLVSPKATLKGVGFDLATTTYLYDLPTKAGVEYSINPTKK